MEFSSPTSPRILLQGKNFNAAFAGFFFSFEKIVMIIDGWDAFSKVLPPLCLLDIFLILYYFHLT